VPTVMLNKGGTTMSLIIPANYEPKLSIRETEEAIRYIRETFQDEIGKELNLQRMSAPMFVEQSTGLNDNLNGTEAPVSFTMKDLPGETIEIVHSLAKWKRFALKKYGFGLHEGLYTNMNAIRKDEDLDNFHSIYVDQWDWEKVIAKEERTEETLRATVRQVFKVIKHMEHEVWYKFPQAVYHLPDEIHFVTTQELEDRWPDLTPMEREDKIAKEQGCVFVMKIGDKLQRSGEPHDGRAPDYDDWSLNGDIIFWYEPLQTKLEVSSMGIRVDEQAMAEQLAKANATDRAELPFHRNLLAGKMPYTIGGGIGQSRLCMLLLGKAHVGEVQASIWPEAMKEECAKAKIQLL
jgi:aspartate--ammonia ligase